MDAAFVTIHSRHANTSRTAYKGQRSPDTKTL
jgi:hypothetical protein